MSNLTDQLEAWGDTDVQYGNVCRGDAFHDAAARITALENACRAYLDAYDNATGTVYVEPIIREAMKDT